MMLMAATAFHGGAWRAGYKFGTIGPSSAVAYMVLAYVVKAYLVLYSLAQFLGWSWALATFEATPRATGLASAGSIITLFTYLQLAEVVHAAIGIVPSDPV